MAALDGGDSITLYVFPDAALLGGAMAVLCGPVGAGLLVLGARRGNAYLAVTLLGSAGLVALLVR